jgi:hypothetical protein
MHSGWLKVNFKSSMGGTRAGAGANGTRDFHS